MAPHLFDGHTLKQWTYQQMPTSNIWVVRDDGVLLALTYMKEHDIWGWSRHVTEGRVMSVCALSSRGEDAVLMVVERGGRFFLERLAREWTATDGVKEAFFVDAGRTCHGDRRAWASEGRAMVVLADGSPVEGLVVRGETVTLPFAAGVVHAGLAYASTLGPLPVEDDTHTGTTLGRQRDLGQCVVRLHASVGGSFRASGDARPAELFELPFLPTV